MIYILDEGPTGAAPDLAVWAPSLLGFYAPQLLARRSSPFAPPLIAVIIGSSLLAELIDTTHHGRFGRD